MLTVWAQVLLLILLSVSVTTRLVASGKLDPPMRAAPYLGAVGCFALVGALVLMYRLVADFQALLVSPVNQAAVLTAIVAHLTLGMTMALGRVRGACGERVAGKLDRLATRLAPSRLLLGFLVLALAVLSALRTIAA